MNNGPLNRTDPSGLATVNENGDFEVGGGEKSNRQIPESNPVIEEHVKIEKAKKSITRHDPEGLAKSSIGKIPDEYNDYRMQDAPWATEFLGTSQYQIQNKGCKADAAAQMASALIGSEVTPDDMAAYADANGNLTAGAIVKAIFDESYGAISVGTDYWEKKLTPETLLEIKTDETRTTFILARATLGGGLGEHWVVVEDFHVRNDGAILYDVVGSSINDYGMPQNGGSDRIFSSGLSTSGREGTVNLIQVFWIKSP